MSWLGPPQGLGCTSESDHGRKSWPQSCEDLKGKFGAWGKWVIWDRPPPLCFSETGCPPSSDDERWMRLCIVWGAGSWLSMGLGPVQPGEEGAWEAGVPGVSPVSAANLLCDLGPVSLPLWAPVPHQSPEGWAYICGALTICTEFSGSDHGAWGLGRRRLTPGLSLSLCVHSFICSFSSFIELTGRLLSPCYVPGVRAPGGGGHSLVANMTQRGSRCAGVVQGVGEQMNGYRDLQAQRPGCWMAWQALESAAGCGIWAAAWGGEGVWPEEAGPSGWSKPSWIGPPTGWACC